MANKTVEDLIAAGAITGDELIHLVQAGNSRKATLAQIAAALAGITSAQTWATPFRGVLVYRSTNLVDAPIVNQPFLIPWDAVAYDTDGFWNAGQPTMITIPAGVHKVRLSGQVELTLSRTAHSVFTSFQKNGTSYRWPGAWIESIRHGGSSGWNVNLYHAQTAVIPVVEGDYFELRIQGSGMSSDMDDILADSSWMCLEVVEGSAVEV